MPNFWDLPRPVRDTIYRLHLVKDDPLDHDVHSTLVEVDDRSNRQCTRKEIPPVCLVSSQAEREAASIYYGENHFVFGRTQDSDGSSVFQFTSKTWTRHLRLIQKVTYQWPTPYRWSGPGTGMAGEEITEIARFKSLQELWIRVDEKAMIRRMLLSRRSVQISPPRDLTLQDGVALLRHPGMSNLLKISGVPKVEFIKMFDHNHKETGGAIIGGFLETEIIPRLKAPKKRVTPRRGTGSFDFLSLPPELRNRIYALLLTLDGPVHPSTKPPSSVIKKRSSKNVSDHGSALNILGVNREIYNEACGIFYDSNIFEFYYPIQLQAFVLALCHQRLGCIREVTIHYHNIKSGGVNLAELSLPVLKQLTGLRRLRILFVLGGLKSRLYIRSWHHAARYGLRNANPLTLPGLKALFELRGVEDLAIRDLELDEKLESTKKDKRYPDGFGTESLEKACLDLERVLDHVNAALTAAQESRHNRELLEDDEWHIRDVFPPARVEIEEFAGTEEEADEMSGRDSGAAVAADTRSETFDGIVLTGKPADVSIRDRLRSSTRAAKKVCDDGDDTDGKGGDEGVFVSSTRDGDDPAPGETDGSAEEKDADQVDDDAAEESEMCDEIVVKHWTKAVEPASDEMGGVAVRVGGFDAADAEMEDAEADPSYWAREPSVEL